MKDNKMQISKNESLSKVDEMFCELKNKYVYLNKSKSIMRYLEKNIHKNAIIMAKCSNRTEVNDFVTKLKFFKKG